MLYNGIFGCHGNICYVILVNTFEIYRHKFDEFRIYAKIVCFIWTPRDAKTVRHDGWMVLIGILFSNILQPTKGLYDFWFKSYRSNSGFNIFGDLDIDIDLDLWPMSYWLSHKVGRSTGISLRSFIWIRHISMGDMAAVKVLKNAL